MNQFTRCFLWSLAVIVVGAAAEAFLGDSQHRLVMGARFATGWFCGALWHKYMLSNGSVASPHAPGRGL